MSVPYLDSLVESPRLLILPASIFLLVFAVTLTVRGLVFGLLVRLETKTGNALYRKVIDVSRTASILWCAIAGLHAAVAASTASPQTISYLHSLLGALITVSVSLVLGNVAVQAFRLYSERVALPATGIMEAVVKISVIAMGVTIALGVLGVDVTPLVAALGVGGLAVALALQDTLANAFAGVHILMSRPVRVGDYVMLDSGEQGYVVDIGWRSTMIRMLPNNMVVVPNSKLVQSIITNYYMPEREMSVYVEVGVHYASDLERVQEITLEVARDVLTTVDGGVPTYDPLIRFHTFGDFSIGYTVVLRAQEYLQHFAVKHEFVKRLHARFKEEGIVIPFPIRTLDVPPQTIETLRKLVGPSSD